MDNISLTSQNHLKGILIIIACSVSTQFWQQTRWDHDAPVPFKLFGDTGGPNGPQTTQTFHFSEE